MGFTKSLMPVKSLQVTRLRLVTWKDFTSIRDLEKPILALPHHRIGPFLTNFWTYAGVPYPFSVALKLGPNLGTDLSLIEGGLLQ